MKKLLIDANPCVPFLVSGRVNGIGRTNIELIKALDAIPPDEIPFDIELYTQNVRGVSAKQLKTRFRTRHAYLRDNQRGNVIAKRLRIRELLSHYDLMHITHNYHDVAHPERCIVTAHDAFYMKFEDDRFNYAAMRETHPEFLRKCRHIITCSEYSKHDIVETMDIHPGKITVIPWGIDHSNFYVEKESEAKQFVYKKFGINHPFFLSVSCDAGRKRTPQLIEAFLNNSSVHHLLLVWNDIPADIEVRCKSCDRIDILSNISNEDLRHLYNAASASFNPSKYEGFGLPVLEAMACGCLCVTCNNSSIPEVGGNSVVYLDEPIEQSLSEIIRVLDKNSHMFLSKQESGPGQARKFTWNATAIKTLEVYKQLLAI